ncbi:MAG: ankyrin repeat domain-containing protein [Deltaproteobacteria bacterium]|nr:ankyrin repeat domain-containing protein [Deltaproteobacteria bacterium]
MKILSLVLFVIFNSRLLASGIIGAEAGETPLITAAKNDQREAAELLVNIGADVNLTDSEGKTALYHAIHNKHTQMAQFLIQYARPDQQSDFGWAPLHIAVFMDNLTIVRDLIKANANVNLPDKNGNTPLHLAVRFWERLRKTYIIQDLVAAKALMDRKNNWGESSLYLAIMYAPADIVRILVDAGADVNAKATYGVPLRLMAKTRGNRVIIRYLKQAQKAQRADSCGCCTLQ